MSTSHRESGPRTPSGHSLCSPGLSSAFTQPCSNPLVTWQLLHIESVNKVVVTLKLKPFTVFPLHLGKVSTLYHGPALRDMVAAMATILVCVLPTLAFFLFFTCHKLFPSLGLCTCGSLLLFSLFTLITSAMICLSFLSYLTAHQPWVSA